MCKGIFIAKREEVAEDFRKLEHEELHHMYASPYMIIMIIMMMMMMMMIQSSRPK
jgi:hypothetical protein